MNRAFEIAGVGMVSLQRALELLANNITNMNSPGFKKSELHFTQMLSMGQEGAPAASGAQTWPTASVHVKGVPDFADAGEIEQTGRSLDIALRGDGFIEVLGPSGEVLLWRGGSMTVSADGYLSVGGLPLKAMIAAPANAAGLAIDGSGSVRLRASDGSLGAEEIGRIALVRVSNPESLTLMDGGMFQIADGSEIRDMDPGSEGSGYIVQGAIERSNVDLNEEMVHLMMVQRAYAADAQLVQAADQIAAIANSLRR